MDGVVNVETVDVYDNICHFEYLKIKRPSFDGLSIRMYLIG